MPLIPRAAFLGPVRCVEQTALGTLQAPVGTVSVCFMYMVGMSTLLGWNRAVAEEALALMYTVVSDRVAVHGGYLVELSEAFTLAVFSSPSSAAL